MSYLLCSKERKCNVFLGSVRNGWRREWLRSPVLLALVSVRLGEVGAKQSGKPRCRCLFNIRRSYSYPTRAFAKDGPDCPLHSPF